MAASSKPHASSSRLITSFFKKVASSSTNADNGQVDKTTTESELVITAIPLSVSTAGQYFL